jgi:hypothetical protein
MKAANPAPKHLEKGYGKVWTKEETDIMIQLQIRFWGQHKFAKEMTAHFPGKTAKQIRNKRKDTYKTLIQTHLDGNALTDNPPTNTGEDNEGDSSRGNRDTPEPETLAGNIPLPILSFGNPRNNSSNY